MTTLWCVMTCFGLGLAQACHVHGRLKAPKHATVSALVNDDGGLGVCPLCASLHFCAPTGLQAAPLAAGYERVKMPAKALFAVSAALPFALRSRPPPVLSAYLW